MRVSHTYLQAFINPIVVLSTIQGQDGALQVGSEHRQSLESPSNLVTVKAVPTFLGYVRDCSDGTQKPGFWVRTTNQVSGSGLSCRWLRKREMAFGHISDLSDIRTSALDVLLF